MTTNPTPSPQDRYEVNYDRNRPLESIFRNATARILDTLILNQRFDYSAAEISRITEIPLRTVHRVMPHLVEKGLIKETGRVGKTKMYILNSDSALALALRQTVLTEMNARTRKTLNQEAVDKQRKEALAQP
jgi:DNA-binding IclR family transcriptional regulator